MWSRLGLCGGGLVYVEGLDVQGVEGTCCTVCGGTWCTEVINHIYHLTFISGSFFASDD